MAQASDQIAISLSMRSDPQPPALSSRALPHTLSTDTTWRKPEIRLPSNRQCEAIPQLFTSVIASIATLFFNGYNLAQASDQIAIPIVNAKRSPPHP
ncbi:MAG: hypothetical protein CVU43_10005 [Chloroflexi bacterium HGW-Chloroflexi-5]|nr:MAG: hypothetical protein CVU43_10005 [Chloroflexi bacterium HGW-Chloroflexi-5]